MQNHLSDQDLVRQYLDGNQSALGTIIQKHKNKVFGYILMMVKDKDLAEDIFQDTFIKVVKKLQSGSYKEEGKLLQWIMRIAHNLVIDHFRQSKRVSMARGTDDYDIFDTIDMMEESVEDQMITSQIHKDVRKLIQYLPEEQKRVLIMRHYGNMSFKEIAQTTDVSINTALGRMRYALINLRKLIEDNNLVLTSD
ncbi:MAG: sigma-70 family RNA polymerase sigma factor [Bacteroidales bacterium]|nr:sigma-70 family RNA polymerase sigma factor [Bacteroidales bacterium]MCF8328410.1 sigma-70 family RNA polymerase sigma factor [Bacteroidales bacterium]